MARKKKTNDAEDLPTDLINDIPEPLDSLAEDELNQAAVITAAKALIDHYALTHTIETYNDYKYPKMKELAIALSKL